MLAKIQLKFRKQQLCVIFWIAGINPFSDDYIDVPSEPQDDAAKDVEFTREDEMNEVSSNS